jgi:hypothetical protein
VLLRSSRAGIGNQFESAVHLACTILNIPFVLFKPEPGGRDMVFHRDIEMVSKADLVVCVFAADAPMEGGTAHIVDKAQDQLVPVYSYTYDADSGRLHRLGEWDPEDSWGRRLQRTCG